MDVVSTVLNAPKPVEPPPTIEVTLSLSIEEARTLRAVLGNQMAETRIGFERALRMACYFPPDYPNVDMALSMGRVIAHELELALTEAGIPIIAGPVM